MHAEATGNATLGNMDTAPNAAKHQPCGPTAQNNQHTHWDPWASCMLVLGVVHKAQVQHARGEHACSCKCARLAAS